jgi:hypothetical protein
MKDSTRTKVIVYGRSFTIFRLINRHPISTHYQLFFTPHFDDLVPGRVNSDIVLVGGNVPETERAQLVKRFEGSNTAVALLSPTSLRDWGRDRVIDGIFRVLNESKETLSKPEAAATEEGTPA